MSRAEEEFLFLKVDEQVYSNQLFKLVKTDYKLNFYYLKCQLKRECGMWMKGKMILFFSSVPANCNCKI